MHVIKFRLKNIGNYIPVKLQLKLFSDINTYYRLQMFIGIQSILEMDYMKVFFLLYFLVFNM